MRIRKTEKQVKEVVVVIADYEVCDKCGKKIKKDDVHDAFEFDFKLKEGVQYPEGGSGDEEVMDLCQTCARELVEKLKEMGYGIRKEDWSW